MIFIWGMLRGCFAGICFAGISTTGRTLICFISTKMNSEKYIELLDDVLINFGDDSLGNNWILRQDNAAIHKSKATKSFLPSRNIPVLDWPAYSSHLNPIENLWATLLDQVFKTNLVLVRM